MRNLWRQVPTLITQRNDPKLRMEKSVTKLNRTLLFHDDATLLISSLLDPGSDLLSIRD
jgi:hypothetical protein